MPSARSHDRRTGPEATAPSRNGWRRHVNVVVWVPSSCATVVAAVLEGRTERKCTVELPGGPLEIEWQDDNHVRMTGPVATSFMGLLL